MLHNDSLDKNRVVIRYWPSSSSLFSFTPAGSWVSFGHVSLQTFTGGINDEGHYISFWRADIDHRCCNNQQDHFHTREQDVQHCGQANIKNTFTLYSLNASAINEAYEDIKSRGLKWSVGASFTQNSNQANCSTLVYNLLLRGGLNRLLEGENRHRLGSKSSLVTGAFVGAPINVASLMYITRQVSYVANLSIRHYCKQSLKFMINRYMVQKQLGLTVDLFLASSSVLGKYGAIAAWSVAIIGVAALAGYTAKVTSNCLATKPSDIERYLTRAQTIDRKAYQQLSIFNHRQTIAAAAEPVIRPANL